MSVTEPSPWRQHRAGEAADRHSYVFYRKQQGHRVSGRIESDSHESGKPDGGSVNACDNMIKKIQAEHLQGAPGLGRQLTSNEKHRFFEVYDVFFDQLELKQSSSLHM